MKIIEQMLTGQMPMSEFVRLLRTDCALQEEIRCLVPQEAVNNRDHVLWTKMAYSAVAKYNFDYFEFLMTHSRFDGTLGDNLNIYYNISIVYQCYKPELNYTTQYNEAFGTYLDAVGNYYEGPEVTTLLNRIVLEALPIKPKSKRAKLLREKLKETFHVIGRNRPYWIQGGDWPMGKNSPMQYIGKSKIADGVQYEFRDVDTGETRFVEQFY